MSNRNSVFGVSVPRHDYEANWMLATNFTPAKGEIIVYQREAYVEKGVTKLFKDENEQDIIPPLPSDRTSYYTYDRIKIGDGHTNVNDLEWHSSSTGGNGTGGNSSIKIVSGSTTTYPPELEINCLKNFDESKTYSANVLYLIPEPEYALKNDLDSLQRKILSGTADPNVSSPTGAKDGDIYIQIIGWGDE